MKYWPFSILTMVAFVCGLETYAGSQSAEAAEVSGKVVETMDAGSYTYIQVDTGKEKIWAAAPQFSVKAGDEVSFEQGLEMRDFESKRLGRTFESIQFVGKVSKAGEESLSAKTVPDPHAFPTGDPHAGIKQKAEVPPPGLADFSGIQKPEGGFTVGEVFAQKDKLADQKVTLRGRIVKYNAQILEKNWMHVRDGTGAPGADDLLVTTTSAAQVGDTVLVAGKLVLNKDFGYGYKYQVLLEDAKVTVESKSKQ